MNSFAWKSTFVVITSCAKDNISITLWSFSSSSSSSSSYHHHHHHHDHHHDLRCRWVHLWEWIWRIIELTLIQLHPLLTGFPLDWTLNTEHHHHGRHPFHHHRHDHWPSHHGHHDWNHHHQPTSDLILGIAPSELRPRRKTITTCAPNTVTRCDKKNITRVRTCPDIKISSSLLVFVFSLFVISTFFLFFFLLCYIFAILF